MEKKKIARFLRRDGWWVRIDINYSGLRQRFQIPGKSCYAMLDDRCVALFDFFDPHQSRQRKLIESWRDRAVSM
jgi:cell division FtsZ-interacting protein ZapD